MDAGGFRGGSVSVAPGDGGSTCLPTTYASTIDQFSAGKGEGIFKIVQANQKGARAKVLNGGGGGNLHNAGGAGGGNHTTGGVGGVGYNCGVGNDSGGIGGLSLASSTSASRIFMGGGGGGGHQNNNSATPGGNGGGIVLIQASTFATTGSCTNRTISVNGATASNTILANGGNDGAGGGGAGGTVLFQVSTFSVLSGCPMIVNANGGNGGSVNNAAAHGGGGAGGAGRILYSVSPPSNVTNNTVNGTAGCSDIICVTVAGSAATVTPGSGTTGGTGNGPLPISLVYFTGVYNEENDRFNLQWATEIETDNKYFTLQRSTDGSEFKTVAEIDGAGTTRTHHMYAYEDKTGFDKTYYYRLYQTDNDGKSKMLGIIHITRNGEASANAWAYPNPINKPDKLTVDLVRPGKGLNRIALFDMQGREMKKFTVDIQDSFYSIDIDTSDLPVGVYTLSITSSTTGFKKKVVVK